MKYLYLVLLILLAIYSCQSSKEPPKEKLEKEQLYSNTVGDIGFNEAVDEPNFIVCRPYYVFPQYYRTGGFQYKGEMSKIKQHLNQNYKSPKIKGETGFFTVRFIVNCEGETGRFRTYSIGSDLEDYTFDTSISTQLLKATKALSGWGIGKAKDGTPLDHYQYLTFKIQDSELKEITP